MGNKLSCSCAPLMRKAYRYEDSPWQSSRRRDGHLLSSFRLWAEVFHVSASGAGTVKWQQVSEDLVPVNITCIQDSPECIFHITAYNSQVDKILDVRLVQPGTRIGQASECFVYWKDPMTNDTWGLNFTSPIDAKQFRECCVSYIVKKYSPSFKFSRKASSSYSLKLDPPGSKGGGGGAGGQGKVKAKRKPLSTPASPSRVRQEPQCTCMSAEQYARLRTDPRVRGSSTLPRNVGSHRITDVDGHGQQQIGGKVVSAVSSTSLYDNVASGGPAQGGDTLQRQLKGQDGAMVANAGVNTNTPGVIVTGVGSGSDMCTQNHVGSQVGTDDGGACQMDMDLPKSEGTQVGGGLHQSVGTSTKSTGTRSKDFNDDMTRDAMHSHDMHHNQHQHNVINNNTRRKTKSTEDMNVDSTSTLKRMLKPMPSTESPVTSPEMGRRRYNYYNANAAQTLGPQHMHQHGGMGMGMNMGGGGGGHHLMNNNTLGQQRNNGSGSQSSRFSGSRSSHEIGRGYPPRNLYLELERERERSCIEGSPPSDNVMFDNQCYATTPSSSNGNSDQDQSYGQQQQQQQQPSQQQQQQQLQQLQQQQQQHQPHPQQRSSRQHQHHQHQQAPNVTPTPGSPTSRLLMEYEMHLRNTLAKGMDAESYSLHTFEALLSQSMENLEFAESLPGSTQRSPYPLRRPNAKSSTLPLPPHRPLSTIRDKERDRDRDGYYSDRNELIRERERDRERDRGYLSDHNASFSNSRCASCIGESARAQWFRHSDGWRSGSSTIGSGSGHGMMTQQIPGSGHKRSPWDSLPSLRQDSSLNDSGYKSARADSLEQRAEFIRQDSLRSEYLSDRESRYGIVQQASIESTDSRMCYLTSSEQQQQQQQKKQHHHLQQQTNNEQSEPNNNTQNNSNNNAETTTSCSNQLCHSNNGSSCNNDGSNSTGSNNSSGTRVATDPKKSFSLHCCCVIVDITPVSQPVARLTSATTASGRDVAAGGAAGGGASGSSSGLGLSENVSQLASQLFRFGSKKRTGVCICNAHLHHGSLDRLLQQQQQEQQQQQQQQQAQQASGERSISWLVDGGGAGALLNAASSDESDDKKQQQQQQQLLAEETPPRPPAAKSKPKHSVKEEFERGVEVEKFYHQINGDIFEITRRVRAKHEESIKRKGSVRLTEPHYVRVPPQLPPRRQKSAEEVAMPKSALRQTEQLEWFDRKAQQRHSARSAEGGQVREETMEWLRLQKRDRDRETPARTASGPSEITVLKDELPDWLLEHLPRRAESGSADKPVSSAYAKALAELLKKPLSRQSSGPCDVSLLKTDIMEWLTKMQSSGGGKATRRGQHRSKGGSIRSNSQEEQSTEQATLQRKRHSLGHSEEEAQQQQQQLPRLDWIAYPLHTATAPAAATTTVPSGYDVPVRREERARERRLRHSASEVVSTATTTPQLERLERLYAKPHKERYQYVPKETSNTHHKSKRERSRRHQTQRSATVTEMSLPSASNPCKSKRKSSSAERAPRSRSPSPCTDPACPLLPVCTDPHCRYLECRRRRCLSSSASSVNLARHQQLAQVQLHAVPAHLINDSAATTPTTTATPPPAAAIDVAATTAAAAATSTERRLIICHECRACAPLLSCQNRKCLNAAKCNSLPRCAADFNRLRTTLAQPPATLDDIEPAPLDLELQPLPLLPQQQQQQQQQQQLQHYRSNSQPNTLQRGDSNLGWLETVQQQQLQPQQQQHLVQQQQHLPTHHHHHHQHVLHTVTSNGGGKLMKSASAASLNSRRRRHKTVHFGENLLREVCQNRKLIKEQEQVPSGSAPMQANIQMLYNFVEGVLSSWVDDDEDQVRSGAESEPEHGLVALQPIHRCNRLRYQCIRRVVEEAADLQGTLKLGNSRYRHRHWRSTAKQCNEMFLRKISDDDRMSLTTAVSDEDDGESVMASPYKAKATGTAASSFNCTGAVRKAGFLSVKKWLLRKKHQIELARKRGWKGYWVCLKGTTLLFYPCDSREGRSVEAAPKHLIIVDGAIMQPIPEHPKRDYIFCLSTAFGDAYLFQAPCQVELENWVNSIHSACAAAFARHRGKTGTLHLLQEEIFRLEKAIESDHKLKHMAELQQSVVTDQETRHQIQTQILQWEENLERLHCEQFRLRCYMASLQSGELPNPKSLLTHVSRPTKNTLNKLGVFTVSSFHAFICARSPSLLNNLLAGRGATKRRPPMLSRSNSGSSRRSMQMNSRDEPEKTFKVAMPDNAYSTVYLREAMSVEEFLASACARRSLNPMEHFVRVKKRRDMEDHNYFVPHRNDLIENYLHNHEFVEVCMKILYQVELQRTTLEQMWGFSVEAELIENAERQDELCCYVSRVEDKSVAMHNGIIKGDEIMVINGAIVSDLDMMYLESVLQEEQSLSMMMRSSRTEPPDLVGIMRVTDDMIDSLVCPPPPTDPPVMSEEMITGLIVPAPGWNGTGKDLYSPEAESSPAPSFVDPTVQQLSVGVVGGVSALGVAKPTSRTSSFEIENLLKTAEQVTGFCRSPQETRKSSPTGSVTSSVSTTALTPSRQLTDAEKLRKVIMELVDTERTYVKHLNNLLEHYLEPMKRETFLSNAEINALFGNIHEIVTFQRQFLQNLEESLELEPEFNKFEHCGQFRNVLFAIGSAFLYYVNHFKLYSSFCASHSKAQKVLHPNEGNHALQEFLAARNPKQQHSSTLESYLIKPIQRILKYPLLLQQMRNLTDTRADEHVHLCEALKGMEKVAEHINEMQRIHEEYGAIFDHLFRQHQKSCKQPIDLSPGDLLYYGGVEWLNISDFLGKIKKGLELHAMCFVFKSAVVFLCKERLRQKKKLMGVSSKNAPNEVEIIRYQVLIPVTEVQVRASSAKDMDSHFLWELIHLRSQLQRRSEKVYVLSNSTADFRNAFLKTIRQIIRESVRNMSIPMKNFGGSSGSVSGLSSQLGGYAGNSQTLERPKQQITIVHGSHTLGKPKKKSGSQRHSAGNIDYDNLSGSQEGDDLPPTVGVVHYAPHTHTQQQQQLQQQQQQQQPGGFRSRSKTLGDVTDAQQPQQQQQQQQQQQAAAPHPHPHPHPREPPPPPIRQPHLHHHSTDIERIDPGTKSEGEEDSQQGTIRPKATLGRTPNHLTLSTTSTLSVGSTGSQARLIQSSHPPASYQPVLMKDLGSPVWKPRDMINLGTDPQSTTRKDDVKN